MSMHTSTMTHLNTAAPAADIRVQVSDKPLPVRMRLNGFRNNLAGMTRCGQSRVASLPVIGVGAVTMLVVRDRRRDDAAYS
jgi:hypothetical protein